MTFGEKLYELRKQRGMSQEALARELNVSRQAISRWELGEVAPDTVNVLALSKLMGVSTDYLLRDDCLEERDTPAAQKAEESLQRRTRGIVQGNPYFTICVNQFHITLKQTRGAHLHPLRHMKSIIALHLLEYSMSKNYAWEVYRISTSFVKKYPTHS